MTEAAAVEQQNDDTSILEQAATDGAQEATGTEAPEEFEVEIVGRDNSPLSDVSKPNPQDRIIQRLQGKRDKQDARLQEKDQRIAQLEAQLQQNVKPAVSDAFPTWDNFEGSESELATKQAEWQQRQVTQAVNQQLTQQQQGSRQAAQQQEQQQRVSDYATAASSLKVKNFDELQDKAIDVIGEQFASMIVGSLAPKKSALLMCALGSDPVKARELRELYDRNPGAASVEIGELIANTNLKPKNKAPAPEAMVDSAVPKGVQSSYEKQKAKIEAQLEKGTLSTNDAISQLRELRASAK